MEPMLLSKFDNCIHSADDIRRKWEKTHFYGRIKDLAMEGLIYVSSIDEYVEGLIKLSNGEQHGFRASVDNVEIIKEFPKLGICKYGDMVVLVTRQNARQWKRGCNTDTLEVNTLYGAGRIDIKVLYYNLFNCKAQNIDQALQLCKKDDPQVINHKYWIAYRDNMFFDLFYEDIFLGLLTANKECLFHSETFTLAEEAKNVFGLQQI